MGFEKYMPRQRSSRLAPPLLNISKSHAYLNPAAAALLTDEVEAVELWFDRQAGRLALVPAEPGTVGVLKVSTKGGGSAARPHTGRAFSAAGAIAQLGIPEPSQWSVRLDNSGGRQLLLCERIVQPVRLPVGKG